MRLKKPCRPGMYGRPCIKAGRRAVIYHGDTGRLAAHASAGQEPACGDIGGVCIAMGAHVGSDADKAERLVAAVQVGAPI